MRYSHLYPMLINFGSSCRRSEGLPEELWWTCAPRWPAHQCCSPWLPISTLTQLSQNPSNKCCVMQDIWPTSLRKVLFHDLGSCWIGILVKVTLAVPSDIGRFASFTHLALNPSAALPSTRYFTVSEQGGTWWWSTLGNPMKTLWISWRLTSSNQTWELRIQ